jgi:mannose-6-phosphate isomerase-like protein (cupin superfamily)
MTAEATVKSERARDTSAYWFYRDLVRIHVSGEQTGGRFCVVGFLQPPDEWTPLHVHRDADQTQYVLDGELTVYLPDRSLVLGPGECVNTPMNVPHTEHVTSAGPARVLDVNVPGPASPPPNRALRGRRGRRPTSSAWPRSPPSTASSSSVPG